jgi:hypothetical protein
MNGLPDCAEISEGLYRVYNSLLYLQMWIHAIINSMGDQHY